MCRCLPFHTVAGVPAGLAVPCVTSGFACRCLATSVLCCHLSVIPGVSQVLCGSVPAVPAQRCFSQGSHPRAGDMRRGSPLTCVLAFCTSRGPWGAVVWGGCCPNSQLPWAVTLWTSYCLVWAISPVSAAGPRRRGQPRSRSRVLSPLSDFFGQFLPGRKMPLQAPALEGPCPHTLKPGKSCQGQGYSPASYRSRALALV